MHCALAHTNVSLRLTFSAVHAILVLQSSQPVLLFLLYSIHLPLVSNPETTLWVPNKKKRGEVGHVTSQKPARYLIEYSRIDVITWDYQSKYSRLGPNPKLVLQRKTKVWPWPSDRTEVWPWPSDRTEVWHMWHSIPIKGNFVTSLTIKRKSILQTCMFKIALEYVLQNNIVLVAP